MGELTLSDDACGRIRELTSLELDGELSQLDRVRIAVHLGRCASCRGFRQQVHAATQALRAAPLERPRRQLMLPRRRYTASRAIQVAGVAAVLVVATSVGALTPLHSSSHSRRPNGPSASSLRASKESEARVVRDLRLQQLIPPPPVGRAGGIQ
ncbi:MAG: zf-HC2 domain-containing protein [Gaiellaceae bacterium]